MADSASDKLNLMIAQGAPSVDFSPLSSLLGDYVAGKQLAQKSGTIDAFKNGVPTLADGTPDYAIMAKTYYQLGDMNTGTQLARLAVQRGNSPFAGDQQSAAPVAGGGSPNFNANAQFGGMPAPRSGGLPVFSSPQQLQAAGLTSGSPFMTPDGRVKYVP
jgi:hypothetical protein